MENNKTKRDLQDAFKNEVPDVLSKIKASPDFRVPTKETGFSLKRILNRRLTMTLTSVFVIVLLLTVVIGRSNYIVASTVTIDVNPSIEITLNKKDYVIGVTALNDDGEEVIQKDIKYRGLSIDEAIEIIIERLNELGYVVDTTDENNVLLITVDSSNTETKTRLQEQFNSRLQIELEKYNDSHWVFNSEDFNLTNEQIKQIKNNDLLKTYSFTKIALAYRINELSDNHSLVELSRLTVRQLYNLYIRLEDPNNLPQRDKMPPARNQNQPYGNADNIAI